MNYTFVKDLGDGEKKVFGFSFAGQDGAYISASNIVVTVDGKSVPYTVPFNDPNKVHFTTAPAKGAEVLIRRIMPKDIPYADFGRGNPFSQDALNNTARQQLYVTQEILDGFYPEGFYIKQDIDMGGHKFINMGKGEKSGDSVNYDQLQEQVDWNKEQDNRLNSIEQGLVSNVGIRTVPYGYVAKGGEDTIKPPYDFVSALVYINGIFQNQTLGAYEIVDNTIMLAEPLIKGDEVYLLIGSGVAVPDDNVTQIELQTAIKHILDGYADNSGSSLIGTPLGLTLDKKLMDLVSVKDFGAVGDYNSTTGEGSDDTEAFQRCIDYVVSKGNRRNGGYPIIRVPSGNYKIEGSLSIPSQVGFGVEFIGDGWMTTNIRFNKDEAKPAITSNIEYVHFSGIHLFGIYKDGDSGRKPVGLLCKTSWNSPDLDVLFRNCAFSGFDTVVEAHGRGVVIDNCIAAFSTHLLKIVAGTDITFDPSNEGNSQYTGMRHYTIRNCRTDQCSRAITITGSAVCKDYIQDVLIIGNDFFSMDKLIEAPDATVRRLVVSSNTSLLSFTTGVISAKRLNKVVIIGNNLSKGYDDFNGSNSVIRSLVLADDISGATIIGNSIHNLSHNLVDTKTGGNLIVTGNTLSNAWDKPEQSNHYVVFSTADLVGLNITNNTFQIGSSNGSYHLFNPSVQKNKRTVISGNTANVNWTTERMVYVPQINADGTWQASGSYKVDNGYCIAEFMLAGKDVTTATGEVIITTPLPAVPESSLSSYYSGTGTVSALSGFSHTGGSIGSIIVETTGIKLSRVSDLVSTRLTYDKRTLGTVVIYGSVRYRV